MSMAWPRLMVGVLIILSVLVIHAVTALVEDGASSVEAPPGCSGSGNFTNCEQQSKGSFFSSILEVSVSGVDGAPPSFNSIYVLILGFLLVGAVLTILSCFIPLVPGG